MTEKDVLEYVDHHQLTGGDSLGEAVRGRGQSDERIGEALVRIGALSWEHAIAIAKMQQEGDKRRFGDIAVQQGWLEKQAIQKFMKEREEQRKKRQ